MTADVLTAYFGENMCCSTYETLWTYGQKTDFYQRWSLTKYDHQLFELKRMSMTKCPNIYIIIYYWN